MLAKKYDSTRGFNLILHRAGILEDFQINHSATTISQLGNRNGTLCNGFDGEYIERELSAGGAKDRVV